MQEKVIKFAGSVAVVLVALYIHQRFISPRIAPKKV